jgi:hypothetical protein
VITAAVTAAIAFVMRLFGVELKVSTLAIIAVVVKILVVATGMIFGSRLLMKQKANQAPTPPAPPEDRPPTL